MDFIEYKSMSLDLKALDDKTGTFQGYTTKFGEIDREGDVILKGAYDKTIDEHRSAKTMPSMFWNHKMDQQCADINGIDQDSIGVKISGVVWKGQGIPAAEQAWRMLNGTGVKGLSTGFITKSKGKAPSGAKRAISELEWLETSFTSIPMLKTALITDVKSLDIITPRDAEDILREVGFSHMEAKAFISGLKKGMEPPRDEGAEILAALNKLDQCIRR